MKLKSILIMLFLFIVYFIFYSISYSYSVSDDLEEELFRLHIIANSDSEEDQTLKIAVRDNIVNYLNTLSFTTKNELVNYLSNNKDEIQHIVQNTIKENGYNYSSTIEIGNSFYPQKVYENVTLPSGYYDGLRIKIGNAEGKNWWCVLFPPMCLINKTTCELPEESELILQNTLSEETNSVITSSTSTYKFKFKIIDFLNNL